MPVRFESVSQGPPGLRPKIILPIAAVIVVVLLLYWLSPFGTIPAGERGIHLRFSAVTGKVFGEGLYFVVPMIESVQRMDIKIQKEEMKSDAASKDLQTVHSVVALNYHIDPGKVSEIYQQ